MRQQLTTRFNGQVKNAATAYTQTNDRILDSVVDANRKVVDLAVKTVDQIADRVAQQAPAMKVELPFADRLPTPAAAGARYIDVVERLAEMNRDFSERVVAMLPVEPAPAKKVSAKKVSAKKVSAKKVSAKKVSASKATASKATVRKTPATKSAADK